MSRENVDLVRRMFERYSADDVEAWVACWDPEAEWVATALGAVEGPTRVYRGHEGLRGFRDDVHDALADMRVRGDEFLDAGDSVLVLGSLSGRGAASGAAFEQPMGWVFELRDGRIVRGRDYLDRRLALEAAGLPQK